MVLHMLRRLLGDEVFFAGLRDFYRSYRFRKAGSDDVRVSMERASGVRSSVSSSSGFMARACPGSLSGIAWNRLRPVRPGVVLRFEQQGEPFEVPVTVVLVYASGAQEEVVVPVSGAATSGASPQGPLARCRSTTTAPPWRESTVSRPGAQR